ncbi:type I glutamate--ammonia ligase [Brevundimonas terrae]|uniref:Glutamine synthetase n=1 Tax=Brevundimonas terrae TaxID=363631 RepID=A0ABN0YKR0_9CAUL|nr:type I glutamate--ammonia ligase [Brevundimonas terrae]NIJ27375.1 glutamine synthetase [Brevundimonas terrae]
MSAAQKILQEIKDKGIEYVDLRFTDTRGKLQHVTFDIGMVDEELLEEGTMFDGSSIEGWKAINESDMLLKPDLNTAHVDPFYQQPTLCLFCDVLNPDTAEPYNRDSRSMAQKALSYVQSSGVGDTVFFGPEAEFFVFDDVRWNTASHNTGYSFDSSELPSNTGAEYAEGNLGHRPRTKGGYFPVNPVDSGQDLRGEMLAVMRDLGMAPEKHHHEVAPAQHELGLKFSDLLTMADRMQLYKYVIHNVAHAYGKSATFMAKPMFGDNGSGMHVHMSIWKDGKPQFAGDQYAGLSQECLWYIGGIIKHAKAINAFANSTTNSYKRLVPGYEAPVKLAYSASNRSASIRIPHVSSPKAKRMEARFPDPMGNPYLTFVALLMAGLDGIENRIDPGAPADKNLYDLPPEERGSIPEVAGSLKEALEALDADRAFLKKGGVMDDDFIDAYIELKQTEVARLQLHPHPVEFDMYYSC